MKYILFYKPYLVLCQFTPEGDGKTLKDFNLPPEVYAAGRLDKDSEGLLLLTNDGDLIHRVTDPKYNKEKTYWVQVENIPTQEQLQKFAQGLKIKDYTTRPCKVRIINEPKLPPRDPPIRERKSIPTCWLEVIIHEGKNRQVRHMTAAIGHPTLRLVRANIGKFNLDELKPGEFREVSRDQVMKNLF